ncbi:MAG: helix-turn-helix transcriptional regulator [Candidatus Kerfeldbacteria bacterium]|nr:helix-turn-helix transcriptional regulator [Candidatus Kerfeldbacteria bacterium]
MQFSKEMMKGAAEMIVLQALSDEGEAYGYDLMKAIKRSSAEIFEFREGTPYPLLYRLEDRGFVTSKKKQAPSGKTRRYYHLTDKGDQYLKKRAREWKLFAEGMRTVFKHDAA